MLSAFKILVDFVSALCDSKFLRLASMELPTLPKWLQNARLHVCYADDVHLRLREVRAFMLAVKAREPQAPQWRRLKDMCVRVCVWNLKDKKKKKIDVTALHLLQNMPDSLWWNRLTPNASPPSPTTPRTRSPPPPHSSWLM